MRSTPFTSSRNYLVSEVGPIALSSLPGIPCLRPQGSITFKFTLNGPIDQTHANPGVRQQLNEMRNDISCINSAPAATMPQPADIAFSGDSTAPSATMASSPLRASCALDQFLQAIGAISEVSLIRPLLGSLFNAFIDSSCCTISDWSN
jgi:hypothetical protein